MVDTCDKINVMLLISILFSDRTLSSAMHYVLPQFTKEGKGERFWKRFQEQFHLDIRHFLQ